MSDIKVTAGQTVTVHYTGTFDDGTEFDSSKSRGPLSFQVGSGQMITGFDTAVVGMTVGESKSINLTPENAYGNTSDELIQNISTTLFPEEFEFIVGATVRGEAPTGQPLLAQIVSSDAAEGIVVLDFNHPMAGKHLNFEIELLTVE